MTPSNLHSRPGRLLPAVRLVWLAALLVIVGLYVGGVVPSLSRPQPLCTDFSPASCSEPQSAAMLARVGLTPAFYQAYVVILRDVLVPLGYVLLGLLIFVRQRDTWLALAASALLVTYSLAVNTNVMEVGLIGTRWVPLFTIVSSLGYAIFCAGFVTVLYTFPDGRLVPGWAAWPAALAFVAGLTSQAAGLPGLLATVALVILMGVGLALQVYRYRRVSNSIERQQTKWVLVGLTGIVVSSVLWFVVGMPALQAGAAGIIEYAVYVPVSTVFLLALPLTLALSILRYRLWDIDLIIRRTLVYSVVSLLLALAYFGSVIVLQSLLRGVAGQSPLSVVASTLLIAALFSPLRRGVQAFIDRRFYRRRYDAAQTLAEFSASVRDQVELDQLTGQLLAVIDESVRPTHLSLWLPNWSAGPEQALTDDDVLPKRRSDTPPEPLA